MSTQGYKILEHLNECDLIDLTAFNEDEKIIAIEICKNNLQYLHDHYKKINAMNQYDIFLIAISQSQSIILIDFLKTMCQINDFAFSDALMSMCRYNHNLNVIKHYLKNIENDDYFLEACLSNPNLEIIKYMVYEQKFNINYVGKFKRNCLLNACLSNPNIQIIKYLIDVMKMNPLETDCYGMNSLLIACFGNNTLEIIKYLAGLTKKFHIEDDNGENCLIVACYQNQNLETLKYLIDNLNLDINHLDQNSESCLVRLCEKCPDIKIIKYMIENFGADPLDKDIDGNNCLGILLGNKNIESKFEIAKYMIEIQGIDVMSMNNRNDNYLHMLCDNQKPCLETIKYFVSIIPRLCYQHNNDSRKCTDYLKYYGSGNHKNIIEYFVKIGVIGLEDMGYSNAKIILEHNKHKHKELKIYFTEHKINRACDNDLLKIYTNPLIFNKYKQQLIGFSDPMILPYSELCKLVDELNINVQFNIPKKVVWAKNHNGFDSNNKKNNDYGPLFSHNGKIFLGRRSDVYRKMTLFNDNESIKCINFSNEFVLEGSLPDYLVNFYINTFYASKYNLSKVNSCDFYKFIKFIDQYPNKVLSIENMINQLITYLQKYGKMIDSSDWNSLKYIFEKYKIKELYMCIHNVKITTSLIQ